jgi:DNA-binding MarR family transcriptional regulator
MKKASSRANASASTALTDADYVVLADFRFALRKFIAFSESKAAEHGLTPQQHQALLALRAAKADTATIGYIAERLILKPHSASGLVDRLETLGLVVRETSSQDGRVSVLCLSRAATKKLDALSSTHQEEIRRLRPVLGELLSHFEQ